MAFVLYTRVPELDLARYDRMIARARARRESAGGCDPPHRLGGRRGVNVCEVWQTREAAESFVERRLRDAVRRRA